MKEEDDMSEDRGHCPECGGSDGWHYSDCTYDGTEGWEAIIPIQEEVPAAPAERFGSSISLL